MDSLRTTIKSNDLLDAGPRDSSDQRLLDAMEEITSKKKKKAGMDLSDILWYIMIVVIIFIMVRDYMQYKAENATIVTDIGDLDVMSAQNKYDGSTLYRIYCGLGEKDREFIDDYIAHSYLVSKSRKPAFKKRYYGIVKGVFASSIVYSLVMSSTIGKQLKMSFVNYFISNLL